MGEVFVAVAERRVLAYSLEENGGCYGDELRSS
jgi:hypothetical protein